MVGRQVVREGAERLELATGLELDDPRVLALLEGGVQRQPGVEVPLGELGDDHEVVGRDPIEHGVVGRRVGVHVAHFAHAHRPGAEVDGLAVFARGVCEFGQHGAHGVDGGHRERREVIPARAVVDGARLSDPDHQAVDERHVLEELLEARLIELPEPRIIDVEAAEFALNVVVERAGVGQHVGLEYDLHAHLVGVLPHRPELLDHRLVARAVGAVLGVDLIPVTHLVEVHVFEEAADDHTVVAVGADVVDVVLPFPGDLGQPGGVDPRLLGQHDVGELAGVVRVVLLLSPCRRVWLHSDCAVIGEAVLELRHHRRPRTRGQLLTRSH